MIPFLVVAGISLGAAAVRWYANTKTNELQEEISDLERQMVAIQDADARAREELLAPYRAKWREVLEKELAFREVLVPELEETVRHVGQAVANRLGPVETAGLSAAALELELALGEVTAERAYYRRLLRGLDTASDLADVPVPQGLALPADFPCRGALVQLAAHAETVHGYRIERRGGGEADPLAIYEVDHEACRARACPVRGALLVCALDGSRALEARLVQHTHEGVELEITVRPSAGPPTSIPAVMRLEQRDPRRRAALGSTITVYPHGWTLGVIERALTRFPKPLVVRPAPVLPRGAARRELPLATDARHLPALAAAMDRIESCGSLEAPWRIWTRDDGNLAMCLAGVCLNVRPSMTPPGLELIDVTEVNNAPKQHVRMHVDLAVYVPGSGDASGAGPEDLGSFLEALRHDLAELRARGADRAAAVELRKLSMLYEDRAAAALREASVPVLPIEATLRGGRLQVTVVLLTAETPEWLVQAAQARRSPRVHASAGAVPLEVRAVGLGAQDAPASNGTLWLELDASCTPDVAMRIDRLESLTEGFQERTLQRAADDAFSGRFASAAVRHFLTVDEAASSGHGAESPVDAAAAAIASPDIYAVWGPPGTGKTTFSTELVEAVLRDVSGRVPRVLVTAPTHVAVDELVRRLESRLGGEARIIRYVPEDSSIAGTDIEHLGHRVHLERYRATVAEDPAIDPAWRELVARKEARAAIARCLFSGAGVHAATCVGMARREFGLDRPFDLVLVDEAGKAFAAEILLAARSAKKLVVVGDHKQLPPTVTEEMLDGDGDSRLAPDEVEALLRTSYFARLYERLPSEKKAMLVVQHRMHPDIGDAVGALFYEGRLRSARQRAETWKLTRSRLTVLDFSEIRGYANTPDVTGTSQRNHEEARALVELFRTLLRGHDRLPSTLVVCPYKAQRGLVQSLVSERLPGQDIRVTTVDAVQGGEASLVVLLMTRAHGRTSFVLDENRLNVALSRARDAVVVFAHVAHMTRQPSTALARLLDHGRGAGTLQLVRAPRGERTSGAAFLPLFSR